jgi:AcrR family transcriptional regulator
METKERILAHANQLFMKYGVRSVTLDDISRDLGISKKTIYQYFENKEDIVCEVARAHMQSEVEAGDQIAGISENALDELARFVHYTIQSLKTISPQLIFETQKYYPRAWQVFHDHKNDYILRKVRENLERGIREGLYRAEINVEIVARMRVAQIEMSLDPALFPPDQFDFLEIQLQMIELYMFGVMTKKGRSYLSAHRYHQEVIQSDPNSFL